MNLHSQPPDLILFVARPTYTRSAGPREREVLSHFFQAMPAHLHNRVVLIATHAQQATAQDMTDVDNFFRSVLRAAYMPADAVLMHVRLSL